MPTSVIVWLVGVPPEATSTLVPLTVKLATFSGLSMSRSFESTLPELLAASSRMVRVSAARMDGISTASSVTVAV